MYHTKFDRHACRAGEQELEIRFQWLWDKSAFSGYLWPKLLNFHDILMRLDSIKSIRRISVDGNILHFERESAADISGIERSVTRGHVRITCWNRQADETINNSRIEMNVCACTSKLSDVLMRLGGNIFRYEWNKARAGTEICGLNRPTGCNDVFWSISGRSFS